MTFEEAAEYDPYDDEQVQAVNLVERLIVQFITDTGTKPTKLFVSDDEELQSLILLAGMTLGLKIARTNKFKSYLV